MRPSPTAGQASLEYIAVISLVAAVLAFAGPAVGAPSLAGQVVKGVRIGLCAVSGDICTTRAAAAAGLPPCQLSSATRGVEMSVTIFSVEVGDRDELTGYRASDGTFHMTWTGGASLGLAGGFGLESPVFSAGIDAGARMKVAAARGWVFPDEATTRRFVAGMPKSAADEHRWPAAWHSLQAGPTADAQIGVALPGLDLAGLGVESDDVLGARIARGGDVTLYSSIAFDGPEGAVPFVPSVGHGRTTLTAEYTLGGDGPHELALRQLVPERRGNRMIETVSRLDLRDPVNAAVAKPPWNVPAVLAQVARRGTVERAVYSVSDTSRSVSGAIEEGIKFGAGVKVVDIQRDLVDATARTQGSKERERFDCLDQLR